MLFAINKIFRLSHAKSGINIALNKHLLYLPNTNCRILTADVSSAPPKLSSLTYDEHVHQSLKDPQQYWSTAATHLLDWHSPWSSVFNEKQRFNAEWFVGGKLNITYNCLDRHVAQGFGDQPALVCLSPMSPSSQTRVELSYSQLLDRVAQLAHALAHTLGITASDRVIIYMPMIAESLIAMLACARIGAAHCHVFGGFSAPELASRIAHAKPKLVITANYGLEAAHRVVNYKSIVNEALSSLGGQRGGVQHCIVFKREALKNSSSEQYDLFRNAHVDLDWAELVSRSAEQRHTAVPLDANRMLFFVHTSGTTGSPKAITKPLGGFAVGVAWALRHVYGVAPGDVWWANSDLGWTVGQFFGGYGPLLCRATSLVYEGKPVGTPDHLQVFRIIDLERVSAAFFAPTAMRAIYQAEQRNGLLAERNKRATVEEREKKDTFRRLFLAGEIADERLVQWCREVAFPDGQTRVFNHYWQTETSWPVLGALTGAVDGCEMEQRGASVGRPMPGWAQLCIQDSHDQHEELHQNKNTEMQHALRKEGEQVGPLVIPLPLPPGHMSGLLDDDARQSAYFATYFRQCPDAFATHDIAARDAHGYFRILGREDDVINVAGHRLSTSQLEEACLCEAVLECAVVPLEDELKGHVPVALVVPACDATDTADTSQLHKQLEQEIKTRVRHLIGPIAALKLVIPVKRLPKTRSGKVPRKSIAQMANGKRFKITPTIEDASVYSELYQSFKTAQLEPSKPENLEIFDQSAL